MKRQMKFKSGGKVKRYDEGGVTEGENSNIDDDTRARALKWAQNGGDGDTEETPVAKRPAVRASKPAPVEQRKMSREEMIAQIPTGGKRGAGPTPGNGNSVEGTDFSRNVKNTMNALAPLGGGVGKIGAELAMGSRAAKAAPIAEKGREAVTNPTAWMAGPKGMKAIQKTEDAARRVRKQLPDSATNGGAIGYKKGGTVSSASSRGDGIAIRGKTKGTMAKMCGGGMAKAKK